MRTALLLCLALAGCITWTHPSKGAADYERDAYDCQKDAAAVRDPTESMLMKDRCMRLKGWRQE